MLYTIEDFIEKTNKATSPSEVFFLYKEVLQRLGFDRFVYSFITDHPSIGKKAGHGVMNNYPEDWMGYYQEKDYFHVDPVPQYAFQTARPFTWKMVVETQKLQAPQKKVMHEAEEAKLLDGVGIPLYGPRGEIAGVGMASSMGGIQPDKNMLSKLRVLTEQFHLAYCELICSDQRIKNILLTPKEKEVLKWYAEGKSREDIAVILNMSLATVKFHIQNIYKKLDANDRTVAVTKAIYLGLIPLTVIR